MHAFAIKLYQVDCLLWIERDVCSWNISFHFGLCKINTLLTGYSDTTIAV